jgi:hypothetical protein
VTRFNAITKSSRVEADSSPDLIQQDYSRKLKTFDDGINALKKLPTQPKRTVVELEETLLILP